ncbi:hypothetical protein [Nonomuraea pusilla]|uniref:Uncharacterized protein n=1 Tax=Nonomuraea pusilla TaxID=46177 RepID=A0A1H7XBK3_9ACTN|nr:hypothetical protein [Nonomuraea pusilla]SEM30538.1 hypothetical protein SAMN05660976_04810 [Nonomuraea pusilla]
MSVTIRNDGWAAPVDPRGLALVCGTPPPSAGPQLAGRAEYSIRLANQGTWEAATGMNDLLHTVTVN